MKKLIYLLLIVMPFLLISCDTNNSTTEEEEYYEPEVKYAVITLKVLNIYNQNLNIQADIIDPKGKDLPRNDEIQYYVSDVIEMYGDITEDDKYRKMDQFQNEFFNENHQFKLIDREINLYDTYSEASQNR